MSEILIFFLMVAAVAYVAEPLLRVRRGAEPAIITVEAEPLLIDGVAYASEDEWAIDRAMGRAAESRPPRSSYRGQAELEADIERQVAALRRERKAAQATVKRLACPRCGKPFQAGDQFCARCGEPHPRVCPQCGERYKLGDTFCTSCGAALAGGPQ